MSHKYIPISSCVTDEENTVHAVYGIAALDSDQNIILSYPDIFTDARQSVELARLCNALDLSVTHLRDIVEDSII